jgi:hypothetical protein
MRHTGFLIIFLFTFLSKGISQDKSKVKFGKITASDLKETKYDIDKNADAVIIADIGSASFVSGKFFYAVEYKNYRRTHILHKSGYEVATVEIPLSNNGDFKEKLEDLKAVTYNLVDGKVVETALDVKEAVFTEDLSKGRSIKKFTFPAVKEGSIIEYEYKVVSDFTDPLQGWRFQGKYPILWSEYTSSIPGSHQYVQYVQGVQPFHVKTVAEGSTVITFNDMQQSTGYGTSVATGLRRGNIIVPLAIYRWVIKDVPALKTEKFSSSENNNISRIQFQLASISTTSDKREYKKTWPQLTEELLKDDQFGAPLHRNNDWLSDIVKEAGGTASTNTEKAKNIFVYVRDHISCNSLYGVYTRGDLKDVLKKRNGNVAEVNLLLVAMLLKADLKADPVILSTKDHGYVLEDYPLIGNFNYVVAKVSTDGADYFLDASRPHTAFGRLMPDCYNGHARVVNAAATPLTLSADSLMDVKVTSVFISNDEKGNLSGNVQQTAGFYESYDLRNEIKQQGKDQFFENLKKGYNTDIEFTFQAIDSLDNFDERLGIQYKFTLGPGKSNVLYFNPMLTGGLKENPFTAAQRLYPVELSYGYDETYLLRMDIPEGYVVDELPKQLLVKLNPDGDGLFEYRIAEADGAISLRSRILIRRAFFQPEEYDMLRDFFGRIAKKHAEQIVFKKK